MTPRLLSFLTMIEAALAESGQRIAASRSADYRKGIARMTFADGGGSIVLQNFPLADGQLCMRLELRRTGAILPTTTSVYPHAAAFDWSAEAGRIAREWVALAPASPEKAAIPA
jgi:hypothetical protein